MAMQLEAAADRVIVMLGRAHAKACKTAAEATMPPSPAPQPPAAPAGKIESILAIVARVHERQEGGGPVP